MTLVEWATENSWSIGTDESFGVECVPFSNREPAERRARDAREAGVERVEVKEVPWMACWVIYQREEGE